MLCEFERIRCNGCGNRETWKLLECYKEIGSNDVFAYKCSECGQFLYIEKPKREDGKINILFQGTEQTVENIHKIASR